MSTSSPEPSPSADFPQAGSASPTREQVVASPLPEQVYETLRGWIVSGQLPPGHRLRVREVSESVGTSAMPVREAIRRLVEAGLAVHEPYKGARVLGLDITELEQAYDARILLEGECARRGAVAATPELADRMDQHWLKLQAAAKAGDVAAALQCDEDLLSELYAAADNDVLCQLIRGLWDRCRPYKVLWASSQDGGGIGIWHFKPDLIAAVRANDGAEAERVLRASYLDAKSSLRATIAGADAG